MQCLSLGLVVVGTVCGGRRVHGQGDLADLLHPDRPGRRDQNVVVLPVQHLLVHALQPRRFGDVCLVVVVPAVGVSGQGGRLGEAAEGGKRRSRRRGCVGPNCRGAPAAVRVTQNLTFTGAGPQSCRVRKRVALRTRQQLITFFFSLPLQAYFLTILTTHGCHHGAILLHAGVPTDITVAVVEVTVPFAAVLAAERWIPGGDGGVGVALPDGDGPHRLFAVPVARQSGVSLQGDTKSRG